MKRVACFAPLLSSPLLSSFLLLFRVATTMHGNLIELEKHQFRFNGSNLAMTSPPSQSVSQSASPVSQSPQSLCLDP